MSSLCIFPAEILEIITSMVKTSQQVRLWQCGDRILNYKLKNGGLKRTSLCWSGSSYMPWPLWYFTTFDGLIDVEWDVDHGLAHCPRLDLDLLPRTLKRLYLACGDVFELLLKSNVDMNATLPMLNSLSLLGSHLHEQNLKKLPSNLIELYVYSVGISLRSACIFGDLPRTLQRLRLQFDIVDESEREDDLPNDLISLNIYGIASTFNWFSKLPKSLKSLKILRCKFDANWSMFPPQLEDLQVFSSQSNPPKSAFAQLPQSLKTLKLRGLDSGLNIPIQELVPLLPKNLTILALKTGVPPNIDHSVPQHSEPQHLLSDQLNILSFPTKLQYLGIDYINEDVCAMLPSGLRELHIDEGLVTTKGASKLPKSLTSLVTIFQVFGTNEAMSYLGQISNLQLVSKRATRINLTENWLSSLLPSSTCQECI